MMACDKTKRAAHIIKVGLCGLDINEWVSVGNLAPDGSYELISMFGIKQDMEITYVSKGNSYDDEVLGTFPLKACNSSDDRECQTPLPDGIGLTTGYGFISPSGTAAKAGLIKGLEVKLGTVPKQ
jgi:hypothetical protein